MRETHIQVYSLPSIGGIWTGRASHFLFTDSFPLKSLGRAWNADQVCALTKLYFPFLLREPTIDESLASVQTDGGHPSDTETPPLCIQRLDLKGVLEQTLLSHTENTICVLNTKGEKTNSALFWRGCSAGWQTNSQHFLSIAWGWGGDGGCCGEI